MLSVIEIPKNGIKIIDRDFFEDFDRVFCFNPLNRGLKRVISKNSLVSRKTSLIFYYPFSRYSMTLNFKKGGSTTFDGWVRIAVNGLNF